MNNRERGDRSEAASILMLLQAGYKVLVPWGQNQRYDCVLDTPEGFKKVQCKTGRIEVRHPGAIVYSSCSNRANYFIKKRTHYRGQVDLFCCVLLRAT